MIRDTISIAIPLTLLAKSDSTLATLQDILIAPFMTKLARKVVAWSSVDTLEAAHMLAIVILTDIIANLVDLALSVRLWYNWLCCSWKYSRGSQMASVNHFLCSVQESCFFPEGTLTCFRVLSLNTAIANTTKVAKLSAAFACHMVASLIEFEHCVTSVTSSPAPGICQGQRGLERFILCALPFVLFAPAVNAGECAAPSTIGSIRVDVYGRDEFAALSIAAVDSLCCCYLDFGGGKVFHFMCRHGVSHE